MREEIWGPIKIEVAVKGLLECSFFFIVASKFRMKACLDGLFEMLLDINYQYNFYGLE